MRRTSLKKIARLFSAPGIEGNPPIVRNEDEEIPIEDKVAIDYIEDGGEFPDLEENNPPSCACK